MQNHLNMAICLIVMRIELERYSSGKSVFNMFNQNCLKVILGLVATGSFAIAFGQEKIQQYVSLSPSSNSACLEQFYREIPPYLLKESLSKHSYALCFNGFNVMYSGVSKTPLWVAEALKPQRLSQKIPREDSFHEENNVATEHRATLWSACVRSAQTGERLSAGHRRYRALLGRGPFTQSDLPQLAAQPDGRGGDRGGSPRHRRPDSRRADRGVQ